MMNKEQQDKLWSELSEESKIKIQQDYNTLQIGLSTGLLEDEYLAEQIGEIKRLENLFGHHNLNPEPQIKTWEDFLKEFHKETDWNPKNEFIDLPLYGIGDKVKSKIIATAKIAKLIDLGYGGMVSEEEWKDENTEKWSVLNNHNFGDFDIVKMTIGYGWKSFISFHSQEQAKEFMSHESNRKLVEQYHMM